VDVRNIVLYADESLNVFVERFTIPLGNHMQIAGLTRKLVASSVSTNKMMA
jgi:hypothetical protein